MANEGLNEFGLLPAPQQGGLNEFGLLPADQPASISDEAVSDINEQLSRELESEVSMGDVNPNSLGLMSQSQYNDSVVANIRETNGDDAAARAAFLQSKGVDFLTPEQHRAEDEQFWKEFKADKVGKSMELGGRALSGARQMLGQVASDAGVALSQMKDPRKVERAIMEATARNQVGFGLMITNAWGAMVDELVGDQKVEDAREYERYLRNLQYDQSMKDGFIFNPEELGFELVNTMQLATPSAEMAAPALRAGRVLRSGARETTKFIGDIAEKTEFKIRGARGKSARKQAAKQKEQAAKQRRRKQAIETETPTGEAFEEFRDVTGGAVSKAKSLAKAGLRTATGVGTLGGSELVRMSPRIAQFGSRKVKDLSRVLSSTARHKAMLTRMASEGNHLAAMAHNRLGSTTGDVFTSAIIESFPAAAISAAESALTGGSAEEIGGSAVTGGIVGATLGGLGRTTAPTPEQRNLSRFEIAELDINNKKLQAMGDLYDANNFKKMPSEYKQAIGVLHQEGVAPKNIQYLNKDDFARAQGAFEKSDVPSESRTGSFVYVPEDDVLLINADSPRGSAADALSLISSELGADMVRRQLDDPNVLFSEAVRFEDENGQPINIDKTGKLGQIRVNRELSDFIGAYNDQADIDGTPRIETFEGAVNALYGSQAGIAMSEKINSSQLPLVVRKAVHQGRRSLLESTAGKIVRNLPSSKKSFDMLGDSPLARDAKRQFQIWVDESNAIKSDLSKQYAQATGNVSIDEKANLARKRAKRQGIDVGDTDDRKQKAALIVEQDPNSSGQATIFQPEPVRRDRKAEQQLTKTFKASPTAERLGNTIKSVGLDPDVISEWRKRFAKKDQDLAVQLLTDLIARGQRKDAMNFFYTTREGANIGLGDHRNMVPTGRWRVVDRAGKKNVTEMRRNTTTGTLEPTGNKIDIEPEAGILQMEVRDLDAIDHNLQLAVTDRVITDFNTARAEVIAELDAFQQDPSFPLSDQTKVILGDFLEPTKKDKATGERRVVAERVPIDLKADKWKVFYNKHKAKGSRAKDDTAVLERTQKDVDVDRILAYADNVEGTTNFGQRSGQKGVQFTAIPEEFEAQARPFRQ